MSQSTGFSRKPSRGFSPRRLAAALLTFHILLFTSHISHAAPPLRWDVQQANPKTADWYIYRGESVDLMPRLVDGTQPAEITTTPATLRYREPALETGQFRTVAATNIAAGTWLIPWTPALDSGAPYYDYQLWIGDAAANNRITGRIVMRESIGVPPAGDPPPPIAGYATPADLQAVSNALAAAMQEIDIDYTETDPIATLLLQEHVTNTTIHLTAAQALALIGNWATTGSVERAIVAARLGNVNCQYWLETNNGKATVWEIVQVGVATNVVVAENYHHPGDLVPPAVGDRFYWQQQQYAGDGSDYTNAWGRVDVIVVAGGVVVGGASSAAGHAWISFAARLYSGTSGVPDTDSWFSIASQLQTNPIYTTNSYALITRPEMDAAIAAATNTIYQRFQINTNSHATISNGTFTVWIDNVAAWSSDESTGQLDPSFTNALWQAIGHKADTTDVQQALTLKADRAWGKYAPDGTDNPEPPFMVWLNSPALVHAAGFSWESYGTAAYIVSSGTTAFESGGDGTYRVGPGDGTNWFGFVQGGQVMIGAKAKSFRLNHDGTASIDYAYSGGDFPILWHRPLLQAGSWASIDDVVAWQDNANGTATATATALASSGFYMATTTFQADHLFVSTMPAEFRGGVIGNTNQLPVKYDSVITVTAGGHNYRIPAERTP